MPDAGTAPRMTAYSTCVRATHLITNAAWFGGSLAGAVALNAASRMGDDAHERAEIADGGWRRWGPVQGAVVVSAETHRSGHQRGVAGLLDAPTWLGRRS